MITDIIFFNRNAAANLVEQELLFVSTERGKLMALRNIIQKVPSLFIDIYIYIYIYIY